MLANNMLKVNFKYIKLQVYGVGQCVSRVMAKLLLHITQEAPLVATWLTIAQTKIKY